jgi:hypothetical protein
MFPPLDRPQFVLAGTGMLPTFLTAFVPQFQPGSVWLALVPTLTVGFLLYHLTLRAVRESRTRARQQALSEVREMLADRVRNRLAILWLTLPPSRDLPSDPSGLADARDCIRSIESLVDELSEEALDTWKRRYVNTQVLTRLSLKK